MTNEHISTNDTSDSSSDSLTTHAVETGVQRVTTSDLMPARSGILSTAQHPVLGGPPSKLVDSTVVEYQGIQMSLREAARHGLVQRDANGNYSDVTTDAAAKTPADAPKCSW